MRLLATFLLFLLPLPSWSQPAATEPDSLVLTVDRAVAIALQNNYDVRGSALDVRNANAQVREAWGQVLPQVVGTGSYTRNVVTANPFAGSEAGDLFSSFGGSGWVEYNERTRQENLAAGRPPNEGTLTLDEYMRRLQAGRAEAAGGELGGGGGNPFAVDNNFRAGLQITQTLFNGSAFAAIAGAQRLKEVNQLGLDRQQQLVVQRVRDAFFQALLARSQATVAAESVERARATLREVSQAVAAGVQPKFQRLSAEVQLSNQETALIQTRNQARLAEDQLKFVLGIDVTRPIEMRGELDLEDPVVLPDVDRAEAVRTALEQRPDVAQARTGIELRQINKRIAQANYLPSLSAVANLAYTGNVPDDRTSIVSNTNTESPFDFVQQDRGFFADSYWNPSVSVGLQLSWNIFSGFQTTARVQQRQVELQRAELQYEQLTESVVLDVERTLRDLRSARQRLLTASRTTEQAETNFEYALARLREGVTDQLTVRQASEQLDQSQLNYLQAIFDYVSARNAFETALGLPTSLPDVSS